MNYQERSWQDLFAEQRHALLGLKARAKAQATPRGVTTLADNEVVLLGGASVAARLSKRPSGRTVLGPYAVVVTPPSGEERDNTPDPSRLREQYPEAELSGSWDTGLDFDQRFRGLDRAVFVAGRCHRSFEPHQDLEQAREQGVGRPLTAVLTYTPEVTPEALGAAAEQFCALQGLVSVVPLPASAGDRIPLPGLTTAGSHDAMILSVLRLLLPIGVRLRASWAALGWKVAQVALAYGADELAGWTAAETLAYSGRVRAAARVEREELSLGLEEAGREDAGWWTRRREVLS